MLLTLVSDTQQSDSVIYICIYYFLDSLLLQSIIRY